MTEQVLTVKGLIDRDRLEVKDVIEEGHNYRKIASEWYLDGELVRRDVAASMLRGPGESQATPGKLNG